MVGSGILSLACVVKVAVSLASFAHKLSTKRGVVLHRICEDPVYNCEDTSFIEASCIRVITVDERFAEVLHDL